MRVNFKHLDFFIFLKNSNSKSPILESSNSFKIEPFHNLGCKFLDKFLTDLNCNKISVFNIVQIRNYLRNYCSFLSIKSNFFIPIFSKKKIIGMLIFTYHEQQKLRTQDLNLLNTIGALFSLALNNISIYKKALDLAAHDPLTGLINRREMERVIRREVDYSCRFSTPFSILLIDIDNFKRYNDSNGHVLGDIALKKISICFKKTVHNMGKVARFGGEEFCIILPQADLLFAYKMANKLNNAVCSLNLKSANNWPLGKLSVSIGIASFPGISAKNLIDAADIALYIAKNQGRNRTIIFSEKILDDFYKKID